MKCQTTSEHYANGEEWLGWDVSPEYDVNVVTTLPYDVDDTSNLLPSRNPPMPHPPYQQSPTPDLDAYDDGVSFPLIVFPGWIYLIEFHSKLVPVDIDLMFVQNISDGWNFVSLPFNQSVDRNDVIVKHDGYYYEWSDGIISDYIFGWDRVDQTYSFADAFEPGYGYWLYAYESYELWIENSTPVYDEYITDVEEKWNIISVPFNQSINKTDIVVEYLGVDYSWADAVDMGVGE